MIKNIVFDLGAVLIDWNPKYLYRKIFVSEEKLNWFLDNICTSDWNEEQDAGRSLSDGTELLKKQFPEYSSEIEAFYGRWSEMLGGPINGTIDILEKIHADNQFNLFALTNWSRETFPIAKKNYPFLDLFQGIVVSGEELCKKPDPKIYEIMISRYELVPSECLFIDNNKRNIIAAIRSGWQAILFKNPTQLEEDLKSFNILAK